MSSLICEIVSVALLCTCVFFSVNGLPQAPETPEPYEYQYEVKDAEKELFFNKNEGGDAAGKVSGQYSVWLPDGRLMTVEYTVDGETGFVPKISFDTTNPLG
ncbi:uncharacterized protein Dwil_GK16351 [Drosophila willistoni]|uniref:Uncharacterized protein n=1 Tax=Drosophila willistoni TaxID=7260 RepID=B4N1Q0_DROWI|nr:pro-resilin [Drosophila willistoni]EDW78289.2 uncharacterized protein Dwil_GK16351 [Drosophila willistoni]